MTIKVNGTDITQYVDVQSISADISQTSTDNMQFSTVASTTALSISEGHSFEFLDGTTKVFTGRVTDSNVTIIGGKFKQNISVQSLEYICYLRTIAINQSNVTSGELVEDLITLYLSSEGITQGTIETGITIDKIEHVAISLGDLLDDLATACGFKWWINEDGELNFKENYTFTSITTPSNITYQAITKTLSYYANKVFLVYVDEYNYEQIAIAENATEIARMAALGGSGVYGSIVRSTVIDNQTDAQDAAVAELAKMSQRKVGVIITSFTDVLHLGDYFTLTVSALGLSGQYYIDEISIQGIGSVIKYTYNIKPYSTNIDKESWLSKWRQLLAQKKTENTNKLDKNTYTQATEPYGAKEGDIWIKNVSYAMHDIQTVSGSTTLTAGGANVTVVNAGVDLINITLPFASGNEGVEKIIKNSASSSFSIAVGGAGSDTIDGSLAVTLAVGNKLTVVSNGNDWDII